MKLKKYLKNIIVYLQVIAVILSLLLPVATPTAANNKNENKEQELEKLLINDENIYDVLIKCQPVGLDTEHMTRKEIADISQKEVIEILETAVKNRDVEEYKAFYIVNGIHALVKNKKVLQKLVTLKTVESIKNNGKIYKIDPIKKKTRQKRYSDVIFKPDYRNIEWGVSLVHADKVWEEFGVEGEGVTVGIIDTGVNYRLPALKHAYKGYNKDTDTFDSSYYKDFISGLNEPEISSVNDHGTHVAGTICGREKENVNQIGVAPKAKFISARAIDDQGGDTATLLEAAQWMLEKKPDIINNSWGGDNDDNDWFYEITEAWREAGILPVFAAGNQRAGEPLPGLGSISNPGNMLNVFAVGAIDINKNLGRFSKKGPSAFDKSKSIIKPDVVAPGVQVRSCNASGHYVSWNGTSMAAPHVAGVAALIKSANLTLTPKEIEEIIRQTAEPLTDNEFSKSPNMAYGYGMINAYDAIAGIKGRDLGSVFGRVLKEGKDNQSAKVEILNSDYGYVGRDIKLTVKVKDDVSVKKALVFYKMEQESSFKEVELKLVSGENKDGIYEGIISADDLQSGVLKLKVEVTDFADNKTISEKDIVVKGGISIPWKQDFENNTDGFIIENNWKHTSKVSVAEPEMPKGGSKYIGINGGRADFEKRVENYLYLPPIDLSSVNGKAALNLDEYKGFTGISVAQIQTSLTGKENDWKVLHNVQLRPDFLLSDRKWENNSYSLEKYVGESKPLLLRFYFLGHDADEGCGWYLDNIALEQGDSSVPDKIMGLQGDIDKDGLKLSFKMPEHTDMDRYVIERKEVQGQYEQIVSIDKVDAIVEFINNGNEKTHWRVNYYDHTAINGKSYVYRVKAVDVFGNEGEYSEELTVEMSLYNPSVIYDFESDNGGFSTGTIGNSTVNDWQWGKPQRPTGDLGFMHRTVWDGMEAAGSPTKMWGTKIQEAYSKKQNSYLLMPEFKVEKDSSIYIKSFSTVNVIDNDSFTIEIREKGTEEWYTLFGKEEIQSAVKQNEWQTLKKDLKDYTDKIVEIRFHVITHNGFIDDYSLGWYIDDITVSVPKKHFETSSLSVHAKMKVESDKAKSESNIKGLSTGSSQTGPEGIPVKAKVTVKETGKYVYADDKDGGYKLLHSINESNKPYTLEVTCYGYEPITMKVDLSSNKNQEHNFLMKPAKKGHLSGRVTDSSGNAVSGAYVRIAEDDSVSKVITNTQGIFELSNVFVGEYTLRVFKENYFTTEKKISLKQGNNDIGDIRLASLSGRKEEKTDYGFVVEKGKDGYYQTVHFVGSLKGNAVRFQAPHKGGILRSVELFAVNNKVYGGQNIEIAVLGYDKEDRLYELIPFKKIDNLTANSWNTVDFSEYCIQTDEPVYIATRYTKPLSESMGVYYDVKATDRAKKHSFIFDGSFTKTGVMPAVGAYAMKSNWLYEEGAELNPEKNIEEGTSSGETGLKPETEDVFIFDKEANTITGYNGKSTYLTIPESISGVPVKKIGEKAFDGTGKDSKLKLKKLIISEGIEEIGKEAFLNNNLTEITLPSTLRQLKEGAFKGQWKTGLEDKSLTVNSTGGITRIPESAFESAGNPLIINRMDEVKVIERNAFVYNKEVEIRAMKLETIEDNAFGHSESPDFKYAKVYTKTDSHLMSKDHQYLINPAVVKIRMIDAKDSENIIKIGLKYGKNNPTGMGRDIPVKEFYRVGEVVNINAPNIEDNGILYMSNDQCLNMKLEKENDLDFYYYTASPNMRLPILEDDKEILGFSLPNTELIIKINSESYQVFSDKDGYFLLSLKENELNSDDTISIIVKNKAVIETKVQSGGNKNYIVEGNKLLRYFGKDKEVIIPNAVGSADNIKEISAFAFWGKELDTVIFPEKLETVGAAAFMGTKLKKFGWKLADINRASLRKIEEFAFQDNRLTEVSLPEITHIVQKRAFANNSIRTLNLGKYTGHIGEYAFYNNAIEELTIHGSTEEIGKSAFMKNHLTKLIINPKLEGSSHSLEVIEELTFADNKLVTVDMPYEIHTIHSSAFNGNNQGNVKVKTDNSRVEPGEHFDILRSDGTLISRTGKKDSDGSSNKNDNKGMDSYYPMIFPDISEEIKDSGKKETKQSVFQTINWDIIKNKLEKKHKVKIKCSDKPELSKDVLNFIKNKKKVLILETVSGIRYKINGKELKKKYGKNMKLNLDKTINTFMAEQINNTNIGTYYCSLKLAGNVLKTDKINIGLNIGKNKSGLYTHLCSYDAKKGKLRLVHTAKINKNGIVDWNINKAGEYIVIINKFKNAIS